MALQRSLWPLFGQKKGRISVELLWSFFKWKQFKSLWAILLPTDAVLATLRNVNCYSKWCHIFRCAMFKPERPFLVFLLVCNSGEAQAGLQFRRSPRSGWLRSTPRCLDLLKPAVEGWSPPRSSSKQKAPWWVANLSFTSPKSNFRKWPNKGHFGLCLYSKKGRI